MHTKNFRFKSTIFLVLSMFFLLSFFILPNIVFADASFVNGPNMNIARMGHFSRTLPDGRVILFGGHGTGFVSLNTAEEWNPNTNTFTTLSMNYTHDAGAIARLNDGRYLLAGGSKNLGVEPDANYNYSEIYNPSNNSFTPTSGNMTYPRTACKAATLTSGKVLIVGGWWYGNVTSADYGEIFDPAYGTFTATNQVITPRSQPVVLPTNDGKAVVFGGGNLFGSMSYEQVELYDPAGNSFSVLQNNLIPGESGWFIYDQYVTQNRQLADGKYLLSAYNSSSEYLLFTFDPATKQFAKFNTINSFPKGTIEMLYSPIVDNNNGKAYMLGINATLNPYQIRLWYIDITSGTLTSDTNYYTLPASYYPFILSQSLLQDGRIFATGGHSQSGYNTNFSPINNTLFITPASITPPSLLNKNLIVNGDAEAGSGSTDGYAIVNIPNWTVNGNLNVVKYNVGVFPGSNSPGPESRGANFFAGGPDNPTSNASQLIDVSSEKNNIDSSIATFKLSGFLGGWESQGDNAVVTAYFKNESNVNIGTFAIGPVTNTDRNNITGLLYKETSGGVPVGTRKIEIQIQTVRQDGTYNDGYIDNLSLVLALLKKHTITSTATTGGTINPLGSIQIYNGGEQKFDMTPNTDYFLADVLVDNVSVGPVPSYIFTNVTGDHTIHAVFGYGVNNTNGDWAAKNVVLSNTVEAGLMVRTGDIDNLGFGWPQGFDPFSGNSTPIHSYPWSVDTTDPDGTDRIMVPTSYNGNPPNGQDGYTSLTSRPGNNVQTIVLDMGYELALYYINEEKEITSATLQMFVDDFQAQLWGASYEVYINGEKAPFLENIINSLEQTGPVGKLISVNIPQEFIEVIATSTITIKIDDTTTGAGDGFAIDFVKLLINPKTYTQTGTITGVVTDINNQSPIEGALVSISGAGDTYTDAAGTYTLTGVPAGQVVITVSKEGYEEATSVIDLIEGQTETANFELDYVKFEIITIAGTGGSIDPSGPVEMKYGENQTFNIIPDNGYHVSDVLIDGISIGPVLEYTFTNVTSNHTIEATFESGIMNHKISATASQGGSISPSGNVTVQHGANQKFDITPNNGHHITDVIVDGVSKGAINTYTFSSVTSDHSIEARFASDSNTGDTGDKKDKKSGGIKICFITKISQKSNITPYTNKLTDFRDKVLMSNSIGKFITNFYYKISPQITDFIK
ncbi:MAG: carboxypeptidase regulatory-like domain-containing protein [Candidatus Firestonebacteria bacterium]|nr:carboxypeptidase regulatory-like domain-containing protein [Candidatus Firestonebacteria bacterium]